MNINVVSNNAGNIHLSLKESGTDKKGTIKFLPPASCSVLGTERVGTPNFLIQGIWLTKDIKIITATGPKSLIIVRKISLKYLLLRNATVPIVALKVANAIPSETNGIVKLIGSASAKFRWMEAQAS
mmetsp:Transcript_63274/g.76049  ORF Transcript_63274/g.76049 Transcript_63274/m.76049 type:complete len:127 (+) Transcript_63274:1029-1409(+)